jgi:hypothetical protein
MGIFLAIKRDFQLLAENYAKKVKANQENAAKAGRPKVSINPSNPVGYLETQVNPNEPDNDSDNESFKGIQELVNFYSIYKSTDAFKKYDCPLLREFLN